MSDFFSNADHYQSIMGRWSVRLAPLFLDFTGLTDGDRVLDVGCGTGSLIDAIAQRAPHSAIVGIDPSEPFTAYARERFTDPRIKIDLGFATDLPYEEASFDRALSLLVFMFIEDYHKAAQEMRRVTRPGGTVAACTWERRGLEMSVLFWEAAVSVDPTAATKTERSLQLNRPGELLALWQEAGFEDPQESELQMGMTFESFEDYWKPYLDGIGPDSAYLLSVPSEQRDDIREALRQRMLQRTRDGAFTLEAKALAVRGRVPKVA